MEAEKGMRLLYLYRELTEGSGIQKQDAAMRFGVNERSIQRDIEDLRNFFAERNPPVEIQYIAKDKRYYLVPNKQGFLTCGEALAVCKVLLESRSMKKCEMDAILDKLLLTCVSPENRKIINQIISNERFYYIEPHHGELLIERLWILAQAVQSQSAIQVCYRTQSGGKAQDTPPSGTDVF